MHEGTRTMRSKSCLRRVRCGLRVRWVRQRAALLHHEREPAGNREAAFRAGNRSVSHERQAPTTASTYHGRTNATRAGFDFTCTSDGGQGWTGIVYRDDDCDCYRATIAAGRFGDPEFSRGGLELHRGLRRHDRADAGDHRLRPGVRGGRGAECGESDARCAGGRRSCRPDGPDPTELPPQADAARDRAGRWSGS